jgi:hypothetical protein
MDRSVYSERLKERRPVSTGDNKIGNAKFFETIESVMSVATVFNVLLLRGSCGFEQMKNLIWFKEKVNSIVDCEIQVDDVTKIELFDQKAFKIRQLPFSSRTVLYTNCSTLDTFYGVKNSCKILALAKKKNKGISITEESHRHIQLSN